MSNTLPKPLPAHPEVELYTPKPTQTRVIARHLNGESNRRIAREEGIDRETVSRILSQKELVTMLAEQQSRLLRMGSKAMDVYEEALDSENLGIAVATATKILEGAGVLNKEGLQHTIDWAGHRNRNYKTPMLPEFKQGPEEFVRRDDEPTPRMPPTPVLQIVPGDGTDDKGGSESSERRIKNRLTNEGF
jgi:hypothetical protein